MKLINKILATGMFCGLVLLTGCETNYSKAKELLQNPIEIKKEDTYKGDTYWNYARELISDCKKFKHLNKLEIIHYLKYDLNNGHELFEGKQVNLPKYDCE